MIYTVTFNPALDYIVSVPDFQMGRTNRSVEEQIYFREERESTFPLF